MARKPKTGLDPVEIYQHASAFHKSYELLSHSIRSAPPGELPEDQLVGIIAHPAMVLSVFASELYLKCLLCVETGAVPETHNLKELFEGLEVPTRHELDDLWDADIRHPAKQEAIAKLRAMRGGKGVKLDLRYALDVGAKSFMELRYFYETEQAYFLLADFPILLRKSILKRFSSWASILPKRSKALIR